MNAGSYRLQVSLIHAPGLRTLPSPLTVVSPRSLSHATPQLLRPPALFCRSGLRHCLADSPITTAVSSSLPTDGHFTSGCSPPHFAVTQLPSVTGRRAYA